MSDQWAVQVVDACFSYGKARKDQLVLNEVDINVKKGDVYALLGPSGCGKTTLLKCITRTIKLQKGIIRVPSHKSGADIKVGFMPQELSLYPDLTIRETLWLFGSICGLSSWMLKEEIIKYSRKFELPSKERQIASLSGGQMRRVSFVAALLCDSPLLILDEPTVGLDPILRRNIWNFLKEYTLSNEKTVLLTTHYIDEAKDATNIGLMRDGKVLAEASPTELMAHFQESSLEQCFYKICVYTETISEEQEGNENQKLLSGDETGIVRGKTNNEQRVKFNTHPCAYIRKNLLTKFTRKTESVKCVSEKSAQISSKFVESCVSEPSVQTSSKFVESCITEPTCSNELKPSKALVSKRKNTVLNIRSMLYKNYKLLSRSLLIVVTQFLLPALCIALVAICIRKSVSDIDIAVVNDEYPAYLGQVYLKEVDHYKILQRPFTTMNDAIDSVKRGESILALHINHDFSYCLLHRLNLGIFVNNETLLCSAINIHMDSTNQILSLSIYKYLMDSFHRFQIDVLKTLKASPSLTNLPITFETPIYGSTEINFSDYVTPSILLLSLHYLAMLYTGISLLLERAGGVCDRLEVCGVKSSEIVAAQLISNISIILVQVVIILVVQLAIFKSPNNGNLFYVIILITMQGVCGATQGFFMTSIVHEVNTGVMAGLGLMFTTLIISGVIWPLQAMPPVLRWISYFTPATLNIEALRSVLLKGWGMSNHHVYLGLISVFAYSSFFLVFGFLLLRLRK